MYRKKNRGKQNTCVTFPESQNKKPVSDYSETGFVYTLTHAIT